MSLAELIRKRDPVKLANDNAAKVANDGQTKGEPLAGLATLALANPAEAKPATSWGWLLHYPDREPVELYTSPESSLAEVLADFPDAVAAEPLPVAPTRQGEPLTVDIIAMLSEGETATPADARIKKVICKLSGDPGLRYAMEVHDDAEPEAVILSLAIRGKGACELRIPKSRYDAFALLELIEKHTTRETLQ